eukprot:2804321-Rhodomonas_salina.6
MHYCPGNNALLTCPYDANSGTISQSPPTSTSVYDCMCPPGSYLHVFEAHSNDHAWKEECVACGHGFVCPGSNTRQKCPLNSYMPPTERLAVSPLACLCTADHEHNGTHCLKCPYGATTFAASNATCECKDGFTQVGAQCVACPQGYYCKTGEGITQCPGNRSSPTGSSCVTHCECADN